MKVFVKGLKAGYEYVRPVDMLTGYDRLKFKDCSSVADRWVPERMNIVRADERGRLAQSDVPPPGFYGLVLRKAAAELVAPLVNGQAEFLPLDCDDAELVLMHVTECRTALDFERSDVEYFSSGRVMAVQDPVFNADALEGARCFRDSRHLRGPIYLMGPLVDAMNALAGFKAKLVWDSDCQP